MLVNEQHQTLSGELQGHYRYYGIRGNFRMLEDVNEKTLDMCRRSERNLMSTELWLNPPIAPV